MKYLRCCTCKQYKSIHCFTRSATSKSGFRSICAACNRLYNQQWVKRLCITDKGEGAR